MEAYLRRATSYGRIGLIGFLLGVFPGRSAHSVEHAYLEVDPSHFGGPVPTRIFGSNLKVFQGEDRREIYGNRGGGLWDAKKDAPVQGLVDAAHSAGIRSLRWPGGKQTRHFYWQSAVGSLDQRQKQQFGLPEYLEVCRLLDAEPVITLPYGADRVQESTDLVEYLNAPADGGNPSGGIDWAQIRVSDGRVEPWGVKWFEYGNETYNTDTPPIEYVRNYRQTRAAMRAVDKSILLGAQLRNSANVHGGWTHDVVTRLKDEMDFASLHLYLPILPDSATGKVEPEEVALAAMSVDANVRDILHESRKKISESAISRIPPLVVSEFNGNYKRNEPLPYRFTLFNAVHNAEILRIMMLPEYGVSMSNYWLFANSHWGMVWGGLDGRDEVSKQSDQLMFELVNRYIGNEFVGHAIESNYFEFSGGLGVYPRLYSQDGDSSVTDGSPEQHDVQEYRWRLRPSWAGGFEQRLRDGIVTVTFDGKSDSNYRHAYARIPAERDTRYRIKVKTSTNAITGGKVGIVVNDARGWKHDYYQSSAIDLSGTTDGWVTLVADYRTGKDTRNIVVTARRIAGHGRAAGRAKFGGIAIEKLESGAGPVQAVTAITTRDIDPDMLYSVVINKNLYHATDVDIRILGETLYEVSVADILTGRSPFSTNFRQQEGDQVVIDRGDVRTTGRNRFSVRLPASSIAGIKLMTMPRQQKQQAE